VFVISIPFPFGRTARERRAFGRPSNRALQARDNVPRFASIAPGNEALREPYA
jgi:hypothetical protein